MDRKEKHQIYTAFKKDLEGFAAKVNELIQDAGLCTRREFLEKIADDVNRLYDSSLQVQKVQDEEAGEIGAIVQNIFVQPLTVKAHGHLSIKKAVENFKPEDEAECDLSFIMKEYVTHPESTKSFVRELELLSDEFDTIMQQSA